MEATHLALERFPFPVTLTRHPRSRRISVRIHPMKRCVVLNVPRRASVSQAIEFLEKKQEWVQERLTRCVMEMPTVTSGMELSLFGEPVILCHDLVYRGAALERGVLTLGGASEFLSRRVRDFLMKHAKAVFTAKTHAMLHQHPELSACHKPVVAVREMSSRWGSCIRTKNGRGGRLCFNWRLVFAPEFVADYLVAHELAHLLHSGHGPRFWAQVHAMFPGTATAKDWLRAHGASLYRHL